MPQVLTLNLNPPSRLASTDWIKPHEVRRHLVGDAPQHDDVDRRGRSTAPRRRTRSSTSTSPRRTASSGVLVEGWNVGWDGDWIKNQNAFSFTQPYPDYDLPGLAAYAKSKGVSLIAHNETSGGIENYERQLEERLSRSTSRSASTRSRPATWPTRSAAGSRTTAQFAVRHHRKVIETAAQLRHHGRRARADPRHRRAPHLAEHDDARGRARAGVQRVGRRRAATRRSTRRSSSSRACSRARWTSRRASSTS